MKELEKLSLADLIAIREYCKEKYSFNVNYFRVLLDACQEEIVDRLNALYAKLMKK